MPSFSIKHFFWRGDKPHPSHDFHLPHSNSTQLGRAHRSTSSFVHQFSSFHRFLHRIFPDILSLRGLGWSKHSGNMELGFFNCLFNVWSSFLKFRQASLEGIHTGLRTPSHNIGLKELAQMLTIAALRRTNTVQTVTYRALPLQDLCWPRPLVIC